MDSLQASRINGGNSALGRRTSDLYPTPPEVTVALMEFLNLPQRTMIWEPAAGEGDMVKAIQSCGYEHVSGTDISMGLDFLATVDSPEWHMSFDWIITNPPFKLAEQFIRKAASLRRPFAFLLKSQYWHAASRAKLFEEFPPSYILPLTWRPDFFFKDDHGGSPLMDVMWCVWLTPQMKGVQTVYRPLAKPKVEKEKIPCAPSGLDDDKLYVVVPEGVKPVRIGFNDSTDPVGAYMQDVLQERKQEGNE